MVVQFWTLLPQRPQKNEALFKIGQNWLENNHLATKISIRETHCTIYFHNYVIQTIYLSDPERDVEAHKMLK